MCEGKEEELLNTKGFATSGLWEDKGGCWAPGLSWTHSQVRCLLCAPETKASHDTPHGGGMICVPVCFPHGPGSRVPGTGLKEILSMLMSNNHMREDTSRLLAAKATSMPSSQLTTSVSSQGVGVCH